MKKSSGFTAIEGLLVVLVVAVLGFTGWYVWHARQNSYVKIGHGNDVSFPGGASNYYECTEEAGSKMLETYPQICVSNDGKHFTQPIGDDKTQPKSAKYLVINEWNVKIPLSSNIKDAFYSPQTDNATIMMHISTHKLQSLANQVNGCSSGIDDIYIRRDTSVSRGNDSSTDSTPFTRIGNYDYFFGNVIEPQCISQYNPNDPVMNQIVTIETSLREDLKKMVVD